MIYGAMSWVGLGSQSSISDRIKRFGFGSIEPATAFVPGFGTSTENGEPDTFPVQVIVANSLQLWLSLGYLLWNNQITRIWMEREWRSYYCRRHKPRVSYCSNQIGVRATRWLQLPYWLTTILMI